MFGNRRRLFREEAFTRRGQTEPLDGLLRVTAPHEWFILAGLALALVGAIAWGLFGSVERSLLAECVLVQPGERYSVLSEVSGSVAALLVTGGDRVAAGEPVGRVKTSGLERQVRVARARVAILEEKPQDSAGDALSMARAELVDLEAMQATGEYILSPYAGTIVWLSLTVGQAVAAGAEVAAVRAGEEDELEALTLVSGKNAQAIEAGMEARVVTAESKPAAWERALRAEVREVSQQPASPPEWLTALGLSAEPRGHIARVALRDAPDSMTVDGDSCSLRIILRRDPPVRFLGGY